MLRIEPHRWIFIPRLHLPCTSGAWMNPCQPIVLSVTNHFRHLPLIACVTLRFLERIIPKPDSEVGRGVNLDASSCFSLEMITINMIEHFEETRAES